VTRCPPRRRIAQVVVVASSWLALAVVAGHAVAHTARAAWAPVALLLVTVWAVDAFLPAVSPWALRRGRPVPPGAQRRVALTFDDGPSPDTPAILAALAAEHVPATFFMLGAHVEKRPEVAQAVAAGGHAIGNHTWSHPVLSLVGPRRLARELDRTAEALARAGVGRTPLFRAPRGFQGVLVRRCLRERGLRLIGWTRGAWDSERRPAADIAAAATANPRDGDILLLHDGAGTAGEQRRDRTAEAIPLVVRAYRERGFRFVTVPELLASPTIPAEARDG